MAFSITEKLAALVLPPRLHLLRYYGVLAPWDRDRIVRAFLDGAPINVVN